MKAAARNRFCVAAFIFCWWIAMMPVQAKSLDGPIALGVGFGDEVRAVLRAKLEKAGSDQIVVEKVLMGDFRPGQVLHISKPAGVEDEFDFAKNGLHLRHKQSFWLVLANPPKKDDIDDFLFKTRSVVGGLAVNKWLSRRIYEHAVYSWRLRGGSTFRTPKECLAPAGDGRDEISEEAEYSRGLEIRWKWERAKKCTNPEERLRLLRKFLTPSSELAPTDYEIWSETETVLTEAEKAGSAAIPFFEDLLKNRPKVPRGWERLEEEEIGRTRRHLLFAKAKCAATEEEKLVALRPLFEIPPKTAAMSYEEPDYFVSEWMDKSLSEVRQTRPKLSKPFLEDLLKLPQFQESFGTRSHKDFGKEQRAKIQAALDQIQK
jgi:hypothetical protein